MLVHLVLSCLLAAGPAEVKEEEASVPMVQVIVQPGLKELVSYPAVMTGLSTGVGIVEKEFGPLEKPVYLVLLPLVHELKVLDAEVQRVQISEIYSMYEQGEDRELSKGVHLAGRAIFMQFRICTPEVVASHLAAFRLAELKPASPEFVHRGMSAFLNDRWGRRNLELLGQWFRDDNVVVPGRDESAQLLNWFVVAYEHYVGGKTLREIVDSKAEEVLNPRKLVSEREETERLLKELREAIEKRIETEEVPPPPPEKIKDA